MKKSIACLCVLLAMLIVCSAGGHVDAPPYKDAQGYVQFIAEFHAGLFAMTNDPDAAQRYAPGNPALEETFVYGDKPLTFTAVYRADQIVYTVETPSADRTAEKEAFAEIYQIYSDSWSNYTARTGVGTLSAQTDAPIRTLTLNLSGYCYTVTFAPDAEAPTITYQMQTIL